MDQKGYQRWDLLRLNEYVGLWGSYGLRQGNTLQNLKIANQIVFVLSPDLLFYLIYQKVYQG